MQNRTIKFRAWDEQSNKMHYGTMNCFGSMQWDGDYCTLPQGVIYILEQYTGLKDKNGKEIYEGDIIRIHLGLNIWEEKEVYFDDSLCEFGFKETHEDLYAMYSEYYEIIGNIHA